MEFWFRLCRVGLLRGNERVPDRPFITDQLSILHIFAEYDCTIAQQCGFDNQRVPERHRQLPMPLNGRQDQGPVRFEPTDNR